MAYFCRETARFTVAIKNSLGVAADPVTLVVEVVAPSGKRYRYEYGGDIALGKDGTGLYHVDHKIDEPGTWRALWEGTGNGVDGATETVIGVSERR